MGERHLRKLSQQTIRQHNLRQVFSLVQSQPAISRTGLADATKLSKTTISDLVDELIGRGYVVDEGEVNTGRQGRKPSQLRVNNSDNVVAVINWRPEHLEIALVDLAGDVVFYRTRSLGAREDFTKIIYDAYREVLCIEAGERRIMGFCLILPSMLKPGEISMMATVLPVPEDNDILKQLCEKIQDVPVAIFNDTACYAYAESILQDPPPKNFLFININRGVGAIIVLDGVMLQGENGMRSQFGHYSIDRNGAWCTCGNRGCLENEIGESAMVRRAKRLGVYEKLSHEDDITFAPLGRMADGGEQTAIEFVQGLADDLAFSLSNLFTIYNTNNVVIGGRGQYLGKYYIERLAHSIKSVGFRPFVQDVKIRYTAMGDDAIMRGAARYFVDKYYDFYHNKTHFVVLE